MVRKASLHIVDCVLKKNKKKHPKIPVRVTARRPPTDDNCDDSLEYVPVDNSGDHETSDRDNSLSKDIFIPNNNESGDISDEFKPFVVKPGERPDNAFLQYKAELVPKSQEDYNQPRWII